MALHDVLKDPVATWEQVRQKLTVDGQALPSIDIVTKTKYKLLLKFLAHLVNQICADGPTSSLLSSLLAALTPFQNFSVGVDDNGDEQVSYEPVPLFNVEAPSVLGMQAVPNTRYAILAAIILEHVLLPLLLLGEAGGNI